jgi:hypothetical protein
LSQRALLLGRVQMPSALSAHWQKPFRHRVPRVALIHKQSASFAQAKLRGHCPPVHVWPVPQAVLHEPQWLGFVWVLTH